MLRTLDVRRGSYRYQCTRAREFAPERERLKAKVIAIHATSRGAAGSRVIAAQLAQEGETIGRYKVRRLMKEAGIVSKQPNKRHRYKVANKASTIADNVLNRQFDVTAPNQVWCGDVTYVWCGSVWLYLALVIDLYARRIVGWACSDSPDSALTKQALRMAFEARGQPKGTLYHSDQGCHYTSREFQQLLQHYHIKPSMSRRGNCWDNVVTERTFRSFKTEWMPKQGYSNYDEAEQDILDYMKYFNGKRCHSYNHYLTPIAAEAIAA